ncbi:GIN domain-containing protein [Flavobacteriaceae bacterium M23B6Z8]
MKNLFLILSILIGQCCYSQTRGNKQIETRTFKTETIENIKINLYAAITIDGNLPNGITISADTNLFELIDKEVFNKTLSLEQLEWIQPSEKIKIVIGAPSLKRLETGVNSTTIVKNIKADTLRIMNLLGKIKISGKANFLSVGGEIGTLDATDLIVQNATVKYWGAGRAIVNVKGKLEAEAADGCIIQYSTKPESLSKKELGEGMVLSTSEYEKIPKTTTRYIRFKIKNNSGSRKQFFVSGPKPEGGRFGYGFPMSKNEIRKENWTIGSNIYTVNKLGIRTKIYKVKAEDEDQIVELF